MNSPFLSSMRKAAGATRAYCPMRATYIIQNALSCGYPGSSDPQHQGDTADATGRKILPDSRVDIVDCAPAVIAKGGSFSSRSFSCTAGNRDYKLYVPSDISQKPRGLIIMLHGCTQNPADFAAGTDMNAHANRERMIVAYPGQTRAHNASGCWNWFQTGDQHRDHGEPAILAGIARELAQEFDLSREHTFIAGLSAGGAMAVIMAETYPDVFSAVGVHSGLPYRSANNVVSALSAMRGRVARRSTGSNAPNTGHAPVRTIIFHGAADKTVHPENANAIANDAMLLGSAEASVAHAGMVNGRRFTRTVIMSADGQAVLENWSIEGVGHAWSGGSRAGSFADPSGPNASAEMVRFFLAIAPE
jgi:poly(hydroxyalkanoate) depolymerase family esterase